MCRSLWSWLASIIIWQSSLLKLIEFGSWLVIGINRFRIRLWFGEETKEPKEPQLSVFLILNVLCSEWRLVGAVSVVGRRINSPILVLTIWFIIKHHQGVFLTTTTMANDMPNFCVTIVRWINKTICQKECLKVFTLCKLKYSRCSDGPSLFSPGR